MAEREIRYCTTEDGVRIAYCVEGEGYPLAFTVGWINPIEFAWQHAGMWNSFGAYSRHFTFIRFDRRGTGLSDRNISDFSIEARLRDLEAVTNTLNLERFALYGASEAGPVAISYAVRHPDRVSHLVLHGAFACGADVWKPQVIASLGGLVRSEWGLGSAALTSAFIEGGNEEQRRWFTQLQREGANRRDAAGIIEAMPGIDVRAILREVSVPTLIVHGTEDTIAPFRNARELAAGIAGARLVPYPGMHFLGDTPQDAGVKKQIIEFISGRVLGDNEVSERADKGGSEPAFRTVLFTDLVGHTEMMQRLGDARGRDVLREHERITREVLKAHGGQEIKTMGDGFMASFGSVTKAMDCAIALQRAFAQRESDEPLHVRVGLNAGEPIAEDGDLFGATVILASRIAVKAGAGEILIPEPLRHLLAGKSYVYADRGETALKGFEDAVRLYEVRWRD